MPRCPRPLPWLFLALAAPAAAQGVDQAVNQGLEAELPAMVVEAARAATPRESVPAALGVRETQIDRATIEQLPGGANGNLNDVLIQTPGVVQDAFGEIHIRGEHRNLQYRLNGVALPEAIGGFGQVFQPRAFASVSLLTGALPAQYGFRTNAVIELQTRTGSASPGGDAGIYGGARGMVQPHLTYGDSLGGWDVFATGTWLQSNMGINNPTASWKAIHDQTDQTYGLGYAARQLDDTTRLSLIAGTAISRFQIPNQPGLPSQYTAFGVSDFNSAQLDARQWERSWYGIAAVTKQLAPEAEIQVSTWTRYSSISYTPSTVGEVVLNGAATSAFRAGMAAGTQNDMTWRAAPDHTLRAGFQAGGERASFANSTYVLPVVAGVAVDDPFAVLNAGGRTGWLYGGYVQDEWRATERLTVNAGLRWDQMVQYVTAGQLSPRLNLVWRASEATTLFGGYARTFSPPQFMLVQTPALVAYQNTTNAPNSLINSPALPERANRYDIGISQRLFETLTLGATGYYKQVQDLLDFGQFGNAVIFTPFNYGRGQVYGVEFSANWRSDRWTLYGNLAISRSQARNIVSAQYNFDPAELAYAASKYIRTDHDQMYTSSAGAIWQAWEGGKLSATMIYGNGLRAGFANTDKLAPYATGNLGFTQEFELAGTGRWLARADLINVTDTKYLLRDGTSIGAGAPAWGWRRGLFAGLSKSF